MRALTPWLDRAGAPVSTLCAVHCAGLGLVMILYPALWLQRQKWPIDLAWLLYLEWTLAAMALLLMAAGIFTELHWWPIWGSVIVLGGARLCGPPNAERALTQRDISCSSSSSIA